MTFTRTVFLICITALITSCSNGQDDESINIITVSGNKHKLDGYYVSDCFTRDNINGEVHSVLITRKDWIDGIDTYTGDTTCTNNSDHSLLNADLSVKSVAAITGWEDENDNNVAAPAADDGSMLTDTESTTLLHVKITSKLGTEYSAEIGTEADLFYIVDDTTKDRIVLHRHWQAEDINNLKAVVSDQYPPLTYKVLEDVYY